MAEKGSFHIGPKEISFSKRATGIRPPSEERGMLNQPRRLDFDTVFSILSREQPALTVYLAMNMEQMIGSDVFQAAQDELLRRSLGGEIREGELPIVPEPDQYLSAIDDPFLAGAAYTYFAIPKSLRRNELDATQAIPLARSVQEDRATGADEAGSTLATVEQSIKFAPEFFDSVQEIVDEIPTDRGKYKFLAGSFLVLTSFVSREESQRLQKLWGVEEQEES